MHVSRLENPVTPLALQTAHVHLQGARQLSWLADASTDTDPLDSADRDWGGARLPHLPAGCPQAQTGNHQQRAPRRRRPLHSSGLGPSKAARVEVPADPPRALGERVHYLRAVKPFPPRPGPRAGPVLRRRADRRDRRDRPRRRAPRASRPRQPAAARRATPATIRSASTRRGSARGRRRSRSRGARSSSSP